MKKIHLGYSKSVILIILALLLWRNLNLGHYTKEYGVIRHDVVEYYGYLPATFIYKDYKLSFFYTSDDDFTYKLWPHTAPNGGLYFKMSMGMSFLYAPFFFMGHFIAKISNFEADGFTQPYKFFLILSSIFYLALGMFFLRKVLLKYFDDRVTAITLALVVLGTNLVNYTTYEAPMPHTYNFSLIAMFLYYSIKWHQKPNVKYSLIIGLLTGIITLVRPSNIIVLLIFLLWNVTSFNDVWIRVKTFLSKTHLIVLMLIACFMVWLPQLIYWKQITGQYFYYSYGTSERFFFNQPRILKTLFSYRKGWFIYTPVMLISFIGLPLLYRKLKAFFWPLVIFLVLNIYIISSWWCWWYGGSYGLRPYIDSYGFLAIPLGFVVAHLMNQNRKIKNISLVAFLLLVFLNIHFSVKYKMGSIHYDSMTKKAYWYNFFHYKKRPKFDSMLEHPDYEKARRGINATKEY